MSDRVEIDGVRNRYADPHEQPDRRRGIHGTRRKTWFPKTRENGGEHRAVDTLCMEMDQAIRFFDPFHACDEASLVDVRRMLDRQGFRPAVNHETPTAWLPVESLHEIHIT